MLTLPCRRLRSRVSVGKGDVTTATLVPPAAPGRRLRLGDRSVPVVLPSIRDARLHVAACLLTVQVLGQVVIDWDLSIAQILLCLGTCAVLEVGFVLAERGVLAWPASALLTGNGVALLLRVPGTEHGDWWSLRGWNIFVGCAALSVLSKYLIRVDARPLFNPSNLGLVTCFLVLGSQRTEPQDFWWGPMSPGMVLVYAVILGGGVVIARRVGVLLIAAAFWLTFAGALGVVAATGHAMTARWHLGPVTGGEFWAIVVFSPEVLIFLFFMITDPRTIPRGQAARLAFGAGIGLLAVLLAAPQTTEFATKVAVLSALTVGCGLRPLLERVNDPLVGLARRGRGQPVRALGAVGLTGLTVVGALVVVGNANHAPGDSTFDPGPRATVVDAEALPLPALAVDPAATAADGSITEAAAPQMARDLLAGLVIEAEALRTGDLELLASATTAERFDELSAQIASGDPDVVSYEFERFEVILHRNLSSTQAAPRVGIVAEGRQRVEAGGDPSRPPGTESPFAGIFLLEPVRGYWLIAGTAPLADAEQ